MIYWFPKIVNLTDNIPLTKIVILKNQHDALMPVIDGDFSPLDDQWEEISTAAREIGYPLFMRTDEFSAKHQWKDTCYVEKEDDLKRHVYNLLEHSFMADIMGLPVRALVFRKYIPMKNLFKAFYGEMPANPEIRVFVKDGKILCRHWYWVEDAIEKGSPKDLLPKNWREILKKEMESIDLESIDYMIETSKLVGKAMDGEFWSVDFCQGADDTWYLIDMAQGDRSWHPKDCEKTQ